jgi:hypothetical protein
LSVGDKVLNGLLSSTRVVVEHAIAGVKRCRIAKEVLRLTKQGISDLVMGIACGLHNLRVIRCQLSMCWTSLALLKTDNKGYCFVNISQNLCAKNHSDRTEWQLI